MKKLFGLPVLIGAFLMLGLTAFAADFNYVVDHTGDDAGQLCTGAAADCSLRSALQLASSDGGTTAITFSASGTITPGSALPTVAANTTITGPGAGSLTVDLSSAGYIYFDANDGITLTAVTLTDSSNHCVLFQGDNITVSNVTIDTCTNSGILGFGTSDSITISNNTISGVGAGGSGIQIGNATNSTISGNNITGGNVGIGLAGTSGSTNSITGNTIANTASYGIATAGTGNYTGTTITGNAVSSAGANSMHLGNFSGNVSTNTITGGDGISILVTAVGATTVSSNVINNADDYGIQIGGSTGHTVSSNDINTTLGLSGAGIYFMSAGSGITANGNTVDDAADIGITIGSTEGTFSNNTVTNSTDEGFLITTVSDSTFSNNTVNTTANNGFNVVGGSGNTFSTNAVTGADNSCFLIRTADSTFTDTTATTCDTTGIIALDLGGVDASGNTFTNSTLTPGGATVGMIISTSDSIVDGGTINGGIYISKLTSDLNNFTNNTFRDLTTGPIIQENDVDSADINYLDNVTFTSLTVNDGTVDVNFDVRAYTTQQGTSTGISNSAITYSKNGAAYASLGTTNGSGYTSYVSLDAYRATSGGNTADSYRFGSQHNIGYTVTGSTAVSSVNQTVTVTHPGQQSGGEESESVTEAEVVTVAEEEETVEEVVIAEPVIVETTTETEEETEIIIETENPETPSIEEITQINEAIGTVTNTVVQTVTQPVSPQAPSSAPVDPIETIIFEYVNSYVEPVEPPEIWIPKNNEEAVETVSSALEENSEENEGIDGNSDYDGDGLSDVFQALYDIPLFDEDADNDGFTNAEEVFMGTNPNLYDEAPVTPAITNLDGKTVGQWPSVRLRGAAGDEVEVILVNAESNDKISLGSTSIDDRYKGELNLNYPLLNGTYYGIPKGVNGFGNAVMFKVDSRLGLVVPRITGYETVTANKVKGRVLKLGKFVSLALDTCEKASESFDSNEYLVAFAGANVQVIKGYAEPGSVVYLTFKSVVVSSVAIADANGQFSVNLLENNLNLSAERHEILAYASDQKGNFVTSVVRFVTGR